MKLFSRTCQCWAAVLAKVAARPQAKKWQIFKKLSVWKFFITAINTTNSHPNCTERPHNHFIFWMFLAAQKYIFSLLGSVPSNFFPKFFSKNPQIFRSTSAPRHDVHISCRLHQSSSSHSCTISKGLFKSNGAHPLSWNFFRGHVSVGQLSWPKWQRDHKQKSDKFLKN